MLEHQRKTDSDPGEKIILTKRVDVCEEKGVFSKLIVQLEHAFHLPLCDGVCAALQVLIGSLGFTVRAVIELTLKKLAQHRNTDFQQRVWPPGAL